MVGANWTFEASFFLITLRQEDWNADRARGRGSEAAAGGGEYLKG